MKDRAKRNSVISGYHCLLLSIGNTWS